MIIFRHVTCTCQWVATGDKSIMSKLHCFFGERTILREVATIASNFGMQLVICLLLLPLEALLPIWCVPS